MNSNVAPLPPSQITADFASFQQTTPGDASFAKKLHAQQEKDAKKAEAALKPKQLEMAQKLIDQTKEEDQVDAKAALLRKISAYMKRYPDRLEYVKVPKNVSTKHSVEELRIFVADIEHELGKKGGLDIARLAYVEGLKGLEKLSVEFNPLNLNLTNLGKVAEANVAISIAPDGTKVEGPVVPLLEEFTIKHDNWFSTSVEARLLIITVELIMACHRMNSPENQELMRKAQTTQASKSTKDAAKKL